LNFLNFNFKKLVTIIALLALPLLSINMQQDPLARGWHDRPFSFLASVVQTGFFHFADSVRGTTSLYLDLINIKKENQDLKAKNAELITRIQEMAELAKENDRLNSLFEFKNRSQMQLIAARVMSRDLLSDHDTLQINKGTSHGLKDGMAVISTEGVVGHIFKAELFSAQVLLLSDRYSVVDGLISRSRARGIVEGKNSSTISFRYVEKSEDVQVGDLIVTSGLDNIFPKGFPIGKVESVENKSYAVSLRIEITPAVNPTKVEEVFIIVDAKNEDFSQPVSMKE
jgi:rod shape-determining protein MreC